MADQTLRLSRTCCHGGNLTILVVARLGSDATSRNGVIGNDIINLVIEVEAKRWFRHDVLK